MDKEKGISTTELVLVHVVEGHNRDEPQSLTYISSSTLDQWSAKR